MTSRRKPNPPSLVTGNVSKFSEKRRISTAPVLPSPLRRVSDPGFYCTNNRLHSASRFPKWSPSTVTAKKVNSDFSSFPSASRRVSDAGFLSTRDNFHNSSRFRKLSSSTSAAKKRNGVVSLSNASEKKYRPWRENAWERDIWWGTETFYRDLSTIPGFLPRLGEERNTTRDDLEERSFCDTLSSFPCSSASSQSSMGSLDIPIDREECFISKHNTVLTWVNSIGNTSYFKL